MSDPFGHLTPQDKAVLREFLSLFQNKSWFVQNASRPAVNIIYNHPKTMGKTLEVVCNNRPVYEMTELLSFTHKHGLALDIVDLSNK